jgi:hypothetical protein
MPVIPPVCCGIDVHAAQLTACLRRVSEAGQITTELVEYGTTSSALVAFRTWLQEQQCPIVALESTGVYVRRITARAIALAEGTGAAGNPWGNDSPGGDRQGGPQHGVAAARPRRRGWSGAARPGCSGESWVACTLVARDGTGHPSITTAAATLAGEGRSGDAARSLPPDGRRAMRPRQGTHGAPTAPADVARLGLRDGLPAARPRAAASPE